MIGFCPLGSGSKGNCLYLNTGSTKLLIDAGLSGLAIKNRLAEIGVDLGEIDAVIVTHEHTDHIQGLKVLAFRHNIPVFANKETAKGIVEAFGECPKFKIFTTGETFTHKEVQIHPFQIQHDTMDPVAFTLQFNGLKLGICADIGFVTTLVRHHLQGCDYLYLEANHEPAMVHASARPMIYKQRVLGRTGHLSNEDSGKLLSEVWHPGLKHVHLAHLSSECNTHDKALTVVGEMIREKGLQVDLSIAFQEKISKAIHF